MADEARVYTGRITKGKLCECGCGQETGIATRTRPHLGYVKGAPHRFVKGHGCRGRQFRMPIPETSYRWTVPAPGRRPVVLHRVRAEKALGKPLPLGAEVHHADGSKRDDAPLVICQDHAYHHLLHVRRRVVLAGGNPNTDALCSKCGQTKPREAFYPKTTTQLGVRNTCRACDYAARPRSMGPGRWPKP